MRYFMALSLLVILTLTPTHSLQAATLPTGFTETQLTDQLNLPTAMQFAPDGRLFVAQQEGALRVVKDGLLLAAPFLTVNVDSRQERGLLGVAFDPDFATNQYVYIYYTTASEPIHNRVSRFTADGDVALPNSETVILELPELSLAQNHNGGALHFGPDGKLYIAVGENANAALSQDLTSPLGKMLRINPDGSIPADNPFYAQTTGINQAIWALGLRNPFNFAFERGTGRMYINDVGQNTWEEINQGSAGANYGWPASEGETDIPEYTSPLYAYGHGNQPDEGCSIVGALFYNPLSVRFPADYVGDYFFADLCNRWIKSYDAVTDSATDLVTETVGSPVALAVSDDGHLYYATRLGGLYVVDYSDTPAAVITWVRPDGTADETNPFFEWSEVVGAAAYELYLAPTANLYQTLFYGEIPAGGICLEGGCGTRLTSQPGGSLAWLAEGAYSIFVRAKDAAGSALTEWAVNEFTVAADPPAAPNIQPPTGTDTTTPTLHWTTDDNASFFQLYLAPSNNLMAPALPVPFWVSRAEACGNWNGTDCAYTVPEPLTNNTRYSLYMQSWGVGGYSTGGDIPGADGWAARDFDVGMVVGLPANLRLMLGDSIPEFYWDVPLNADSYQIFVALLDAQGGVAEVLHFNETPYAPPEVDCTLEFTCTWTLPTDGPIPAGTYIWAVKAYNGDIPSTVGNADGWAIAETFVVE